MADHLPYIGSGPYGFASAAAMMLGKDGPAAEILEFATCSSFGMEVVGGNAVLFNPFGWDPVSSLDPALRAAGWKSTLIASQSPIDALTRLNMELRKGPVFVGPLDLGHLRYHPGMTAALGADHYVVVLRIVGNAVEIHDPHGFPYVTLPINDFMAAWRAEKIAYGKPYMMRIDFHKVEENVTDKDIIRRSLVRARHLLAAEDESNMPLGYFRNEEAAERLARMTETNSLKQHIRWSLICFSIRIGARRLSNSASCLRMIGLEEAASIVLGQARIVGALQYPFAVGDNVQAGKLLRALVPTYETLRLALGKASEHDTEGGSCLTKRECDNEDKVQKAHSS
jgi:hypothetical protein